STPQQPSAGFLVPSELRSITSFAQDIREHSAISQLNLVLAQSFIRRAIETGKTDPSQDKASEGALHGAAATAAQRRFFAGNAAFQPLLGSVVGFRLRESATDVLSLDTRQLLKERNLVF